MTGQRYRAAALDGFTIVLDLHAGGYAAVPGACATKRAGLEEVAAALNASPADFRLPDPASVPRAHRGLDDGAGSTATPVRASDWLRLATALPPALWALWFGRPVSWIPREDMPVPLATPETIDAARRFRSMRPYLPLLSRCLPHSLLLRSFLHRGGHASILVIGVRLFPFEAHSWVQAGDVALTDDPDLIASYSLIAAG